MKTTLIHLLGALICFVPSSVLVAQDFDLEWFPKQKKDGFSYSITYLQGAGEQIYAFYETTSGLGPHEHSVSRLNERLQTVARESLNKKDAGAYSRMMSVSVGDGFLVAFAYHYDEDKQEAIFSRSVLSSETLKPTQPFQPVKTVAGVDWNSHEPRFYPVGWSLSPGGDMIIVNVLLNQRSPNPESVWFIMNMDGEVIREESVPSSKSRGQFSLSDSGILNSIGVEEEEGPLYLFTTNIFTGESTRKLLPDTESNYRTLRDQHDQPCYLSWDERDDNLGLVLFSPGIMETPVAVRIPEEQLDLLASKKERRSGIWPLMEQAFIDVFQASNGSFIVTTEYRSQDITTNSFLFNNITSICIDPSGTIQWIRCIPRTQSEYKLDHVSAVVFHTTKGIHFLYNEGSNNLTLNPGDKPKGFGNAGSGDDIIALATITEEGELTREVFYDLSGDKMWLNIMDSGLVSDDLIILRMNMKQNEILGKLRITD